MRRAAPVTVLVVALGSWLAAGPGGLTLRELFTCRDHPTHHMGAPHQTPPQQGPCFCDQMTHGLDFAVSIAAPTPPAPALTLVAPPRAAARPTHVAPPASPAFPPTPPPPNALG
jgi:hypothetical protein